jgi:hypothetical protein
MADSAKSLSIAIHATFCMRQLVSRGTFQSVGIEGNWLLKGTVERPPNREALVV